MGNARHEARNSNWLVGALTMTPQTACPIILGSTGVWVDGSESTSTPVAKWRNADGTDQVVGNVTKEYDPVRVVDTSVITLTDYTYSATTKKLTAKANGALGTIDGQTMVVGDRVTRIIGDAQDGIYTVTALGAAGSKAAFTRAFDMNATGEFTNGAVVAARVGTTYANTLWMLTIASGFVMDTNTPSFTQTATAVTFASVKTALGTANSAVDFNKQALTGVDAVELWNAAGTFKHDITNTATANHTLAIPDANVTIAQSGVATAAGTATNVAEARSGFAYFLNPIAQSANAAAATLVADAVVADGAQVVAAQPDYPRKLALFITDGDSSISAGTLALVGVGPSGEAVTESIALTGGTATKISTKAYATLTSATVAGLAGNDGADKIALGVASALGLPGCKTPASSTFAVHKSNVDDANEAVGTVDAAAGTIVPTTVPNGAHDYAFWFTFACTPTQNSHTHNQT